MKLVDALEILKRPRFGDPAPLCVSLVCGFEPVHLRAFLAAHLTEMLPSMQVQVGAGVFDDLLGDIQRATGSPVDAMCVVIEWTDIDPRLGLRRLGGWRVSDTEDLVEQAALQLDRLEYELANAAESTRVVLCPPTLPLPPLFPERPEESGAAELALRSAVAALAARLARKEAIRVGSLQLLDQLSPPRGRRDLKAELTVGAPYSLEHTSAVAELLARLISDPTPKKGLITDLDDTLWAGSVGEVGPGNVSWSLDSHTQHHALYQQLLASLASSGVLVGVASRNDPQVVARVFQRPDLQLTKNSVFPLEARWGPKSESIRRILEVWNISADAVVFVDNSRLELDEAQDVFPDLETIRFPGDEAGLWPFLTHLRTLFGSRAVTPEDGIRLQSIRAAAPHREAMRAPGGGSGDFLARANGALEFGSGGAATARALDLINKTNQFNLNGRRMTAPALDRVLGGGSTRLVTASYQDRYGPLGIVAALLVRRGPSGLAIDSWVMSCRAFSRRVEHHCLQYVFSKFGVDEISLLYRPTDRNLPFRVFLRSLLAESAQDPFRLTLEAFTAATPALVHRVSESDR